MNRLKIFSRRQVNTFFGLAYGFTLLFAMFPPLYLWGSGSNYLILGIPFAIMYWIINALALALILVAYYIVEAVRGELDDDQLVSKVSPIGE